jgi:DNA-binding transcriptional ArsR family regulator/DNA-binding PadR family transcriptional regulator
MGESARAAVLVALLDGRALAASTLAAEAGVAPSTVSGHLSRLVDGGLIKVEASGRYRYFRLAGPEVADAVEALTRLAPSPPIRSLRQSMHSDAIRRARSCYDHLAGKLGVALADSLVESGFIRIEGDPNGTADPIVGAGRSLRYSLTPEGRERLADLGVMVTPSRQRPMVRYCLDWSEQRPHLGGQLGAALFDRLVELGWLERGERRVVRITSSGRSGLLRDFAIDAMALD